MTDTRGTPIDFLGGTFTLQPDSGAAVVLTQANGKLLMPAWSWRGLWSEETSYIIGDVVKSGDELFRAIQPNTNVSPKGAATEWEIFAQFTILVSNSETDNYTWKTGSYKLDVTYGNSDVEEGYMKGRVTVTDD